MPPPGGSSSNLTSCSTSGAGPFVGADHPIDKDLVLVRRGVGLEGHQLVDSDFKVGHSHPKLLPGATAGLSMGRGRMATAWPSRARSRTSRNDMSSLPNVRFETVRACTPPRTSPIRDGTSIASVVAMRVSLRVVDGDTVWVMPATPAARHPRMVTCHRAPAPARFSVPLTYRRLIAGVGCQRADARPPFPPAVDVGSFAPLCPGRGPKRGCCLPFEPQPPSAAESMPGGDCPRPASWGVVTG
jgi:hypothetical protein